MPQTTAHARWRRRVVLLASLALAIWCTIGAKALEVPKESPATPPSAATPQAARANLATRPLTIDLKRPHPRVAATPAELERLRRAYRGGGAAHAVVAARVRQATARLAEPVHFPVRGGQHNQWYQCNSCQHALQTVDDTHHRCPLCGKVYRGRPYDDVVFGWRHADNLGSLDEPGRLSDAAWAYAITREQRVARDAADILLGYARRYRGYPLHSNDRKEGPEAAVSGARLFEQTLGEAMRMAWSIAPAYDLIHDAPVLTDADRAAIRDDLIRPMLETIGRYRAGRNNWQSWHNAAMVWGGAVLGDEAWVRRGLEDPDNGFRYQMRASVRPCGLWYENSWSYHFYTLEALVETAEAARRLDIDLWGEPALQAMCTLAPRCVMGDGTLPRFGDAVNTRLQDRRVRPLLELAARAYPDAGLGGLFPPDQTWAAVLAGGVPVRGTPAAPTSTLLEDAGQAILRTAGEAHLTAAMTFGPYEGSHSHFDKLGFVFFGYGRELGVDPGRAASQAYRLPIHRGWYRGSISHNTVLVDGQRQAQAGGHTELFTHQPSYAAAAAWCSEAYPGVRHRRLLVLGPQYLLVLDDLQADRPRRFTWLYHNRGQLVTSAPGVAPARPDLRMPGARYLRDFGRARTSGPLEVAFHVDGLVTHLLMAGARDSSVEQATGPGESVEARVPMVAISRQGRQAVFAAVLEPVPAGAVRRIVEVTAERSGQALTVRVRRQGDVDVVTWEPGVVRVEAGGREVLRSTGAPHERADTATIAE